MSQPGLQTRSVQIIGYEGLQLKDLNRNGTVAPYEDWRLSPEERSEDLLSPTYALFKFGEGLSYQK